MHHWIARSIVLMILLANIAYGSVTHRIKYDFNESWVKKSFLLNKSTKVLWSQIHNYYKEKVAAFESITPYLRNLGIERTDKVYSYPDYSINITLYLMDQLGCSTFGYGNLFTEENEGLLNQLNIKYIIISDTAGIPQAELIRLQEKKIGEYQNIQIFRN